jgi:hypothetical protein
MTIDVGYKLRPAPPGPAVLRLHNQGLDDREGQLLAVSQVGAHLLGLRSAICDGDVDAILETQASLSGLICLACIPFSATSPIQDLFQTCLELLSPDCDVPPEVCASSLSLLATFLFTSDQDEALGDLFLSHNLHLSLLDDGIPNWLEAVAALASQSHDCRDAVLDLAPLSHWLELARSRRLQREILHFVAACLAFPLPRADSHTAMLIFDIYLGSSLAAEAIMAMEVAAMVQPDCIVLEKRLVDHLFAFLDSGFHCARVVRLFELLGEDVVVFLPLDRLFLYVIDGRITTPDFLCCIGRLIIVACRANDAPRAIERVLRAGGHEAIRVVAEEGSFDAKMAACVALNTMIERGNGRQIKFLVGEGMLESIVGCLAAGDTAMVRAALSAFLRILDVEMTSGDQQHLEMLSEFYAEDTIQGLSCHDDRIVRERMEDIEATLYPEMDPDK